MKNISFFLTTAQIRNRTKTVTRRMGWANLAPGTTLRAVVKGQGLRKGERAETIALIRVVGVRRERLQLLLDAPDYGRREVDLEGFPEMSVPQFIEMFCASHKACTVQTPITRIEFEYLEVAP